MKITKRQLRRIIKEEKAKLVNEDAFSDVMRTASQILGPDIELDEEMDGNIVIVADPMDVETKYGELMSAFPNGEMVEDGFVTGLAEQTLARTESGDPQSYKDFASRLDEVTRMLADIAIDYVDSGWLVDGDHSTLANDTDNVIDKVESLAMAAMGLAKNMGEA